MDIIDFWQKQVDKWNEENHCGLCWEFGAPLQQSQSNIQQLREDTKCCVQVFITDLSWEKHRSYNPTTGLVVSEYCDWTFNLFMLIPSELGKNNYNEISGYPIEESKWLTIFKPLIDCTACDPIIDFCEILGYNVQIPKWGGKTVHNYLAMVYDGIRITTTFRVYM
jgi:hypothetical protein